MIPAALVVAAALSLVGCSSKLSNEYVIVKQYKGLEVTGAGSTEVSDEEIEQTIQSNLQAAAERVPVTDRAAQTGDWVNIDYVGSIDGVEFSGGTAQGQDLELGSGSYIGASGDYAGFEDQIAGHSTGEAFDITVQFPENYSADMSGKVAVFHITLNEIFTKSVPELTDEWVAANSQESKTIDEYKEEIRTQLEESASSQAEYQLSQTVSTALMDNIEVKKYPEDIVDKQVQNAKEQYIELAETNGMTLEELLTSQINMTEDEFDEKLKEYAQESVIFDEAIKLIANKERLTPSEKEYEEKIAEAAKEYGLDAEQYKEQFGEDEIKSSILRDIVIKYLVDKCVETK